MSSTCNAWYAVELSFKMNIYSRKKAMYGATVIYSGQELTPIINMGIFYSHMLNFIEIVKH